VTRHSTVAASVALVLALATAGATALATSPTPARMPAWSANQSVEFRWKDGSLPPGWMKVALSAAVADSNASRGARAAVLSQQGDGNSWIGYTSDMPSGHAIAYTVANQPYWFSMRMRPHGYRLDWGTLRWCQFYDDPPSGCYDAEMVALHELGHVQTLGHPDEDDVTDWLDTVMHAYPKSKAKVGWNAHAFGRCDVARLQIVYRALTPSTPYSSCLSLASELLLGANATNLESGDSVTFSARLKVADDAPYPNLAGQPASDRTVRLQRRAPGSTSWTTVADMLPVNGAVGTYTRTVSPTGTYDWRALFPNPAEGLESSSSSVIRVSVYAACQPAKASEQRIAPQYVIC